MSENVNILPEVQPKDSVSPGLNLLAFFIPIIGAVLYLANKSEYPIKAKAIGRSALGGFLFMVLPKILLLLFRH